MADTKVTALSALTQPLHTDLVYAVDDPSGSPTSQKLTVRNLTKGFGHNILHYGAAGDSNYSTGGGTDDSGALLAAATAAKAAGGDSLVIIPGNRTYRLSSQVTLPTGITYEGLGSYDGAQETPPTFVWDGADLGIPFLITTANDNIFTTTFRNFAVTSKASGNQMGGVFLFETTGGAPGKLDTGTCFEDVWMLLVNGHAIELDNHGATNFNIRRGRFDSIYGGYAIKANLGGSGKQLIMQIDRCAYQSGTAASQGDGFLFLDGEGATTNGDGSSFVTIDGLHTEITLDLDETYAAGTNPYDKRGVIRLGVKPSISTLQHALRVSGWHNSVAPSLDSFSCVQITASSGTAADASDKVSLIIDMGNSLSSTDSGDSGATQEWRVVGGLVPAERMYPWKGNFRHSRIEWGHGPDNTGEGVRSFIHHRDGAYCVRGLGAPARTVAQLDAFPIGPAYGYVTDATSTTLGSTVAGGGSNKVLVFHNGSAWKIYAVVN